jgi:cytochrome P450
VTDLEHSPFIDPFDNATQQALPELIEQFHADGQWLVRTPMWFLVVGYEETKELWKDDRFATPIPTILEMQGVTEGLLHDRASNNILARNDDDHTRIRRLVSPAFTPKAVDQLRPMMRSYLHERVDAIAPAGRCEFVTEVAEAYPIAIICELVGAPRSDWPLFSRWADSIFKQAGFELATTLPEIEGAYVELEAYLDELITRRTADPGDDLLSQLIATSAADGDRLNPTELIDVVTAILIGGTDTTRNQLGMAVLLLTQRPGAWDRLVGDPEAVRLAVDEVLRYEPTASGTMRVATEDVTYRDVTFPKDAVLLLSSHAANRDPSAVSICPHQFSPEARRDGWTTLTFGTGRHYCLGANLARAELQEALAVLPARLGDLTVVGEPEMKPPMGLHGPRRLELTFTARSTSRRGSKHPAQPPNQSSAAGRARYA